MIVAPADIALSDPWSVTKLGARVVVSTRSGQIDNVALTRGAAATVSLQRTPTPTHHFHIGTPTEPDKWEVWFDEQGMPIKIKELYALAWQKML